MSKNRKKKKGKKNNPQITNSYATEYGSLRDVYNISNKEFLNKREKLMFYFGSTHKKYGLDRKKAMENKGLIDRMSIWSNMTMAEIRGQDHKNIGAERIPINQLKQKLPEDFFSGDIKSVEVLRFGGKSCRLIGVYSAPDNIFDVAFVDYSLELYNH